MKFLTFFLLSLSLSLAKTPSEIDEIVREIAPDCVEATIAIMLKEGSGSGVIVSADGLVITAAHVTSTVNTQMDVLLSDGRILSAISLGVDHTTDGALLQITDPGPFPFRPYIREKNYDVGDWVIATGHPGGPIVSRPPPVRLGRISKAGKKSGFTDALISSAMIISGDSGGPLFNLKGEVIGINSNISGRWDLNRHVPMPAIVARWDDLLASKTFGKGGTVEQREEFKLDDPFRKLRERFWQVVEEFASSDPEAAAFQKRPRLIDPHHMQRFLDRLKPDPEAEKAPRYGFRIDLTKQEIIISEVIPDSPAAQAGLRPGDRLLLGGLFNETSAASTPAQLAFRLAQGGPVSFLRPSGEEITLTPEKVPERKHFTQPIAGLVEMVVTEGDDDPGEASSVSKSEFLEPLAELEKEIRKSVLPIEDPLGQLICYATVIHASGQMLTKASMIEERTDLSVRIEETTYPLQVRATDDQYDVALVRALAPGLTGLSWEIEEPEVGQLLVTPGQTGLIAGIVTQPLRKVPKKGYELNQEKDRPTATLGVTYLSGTELPTVETVRIGSPADRVGILEGDEIVRFEGQRLADLDQFIRLLSQKSPGEKIALLLKRGENEIKVEPILDLPSSNLRERFDEKAVRRDSALIGLSANGGSLSERKADFPLAIFHDQQLNAKLVGTPLVNLEGKVVGLNIARALRTRSLAIPIKELDRVVVKLRRQTLQRR